MSISTPICSWGSRPGLRQNDACARKGQDVVVGQELVRSVFCLQQHWHARRLSRARIASRRPPDISTSTLGCCVPLPGRNRAVVPTQSIATTTARLITEDADQLHPSAAVIQLRNLQGRIDASVHQCVCGSVAVARDDQQIRKYLGCSRGLPFRNAGERDKYAHAIHSILLRRGVIAE